MSFIICHKWQGRLGNILFQFSLGKILEMKTDSCFLHPPIKEFGIPGTLKLLDKFRLARSKAPLVLEGHRIDFEAALQAIQNGHPVVIKGYFVRAEYFESFKEDIKTWLGIDNCKSTQYNLESKTVIHLRIGDNMHQFNKGRVHHNYPLLPLKWYKKVIGDRPVLIVTDLKRYSNHPYLDVFQKAFPDVQLTGSERVVDDFNVLLQANSLCISVSTFSWWAAFLSEASEIHYPLAGFLDPQTRSDVNLIIYDVRWQYHQVETPSPWLGTEEQIQSLMIY